MKKKGKCEVCPCGCEVAEETWHCIVFNKEICSVCCTFDMDADSYMGIKNPRQMCIKAQCPVCFERSLDMFVLDRPGMKQIFPKKKRSK